MTELFANAFTIWENDNKQNEKKEENKATQVVVA